MGLLCDAAPIVLTALLCFKVSLAQEALQPSSQNPGYETTIWTEGQVTDTVVGDYFSLKPSASAAIISNNLLITLEEPPPLPATPSIHAANVLQTDLFKSSILLGFRRIIRISIPILDSDARAPKLAIYKVEPGFETQGLKPITISAIKPSASDICTMSMWKKDNLLYSAGRAVAPATECPDSAVGGGTSPHLCVKLQTPTADYNTMRHLEGGLLVCKNQLAGLYSSQISKSQETRYFLDLAPYKGRIEKAIIDNAGIPGNSARGTTSAVLCVVFAAFVAIGSAL